MTLSRVWLSFWYVSPDGVDADLDPQSVELLVNAWCTPAVVVGHCPDELLDLEREGRAPYPCWPGLPSPEVAKSLAVPANDGGGFDDDQDVRPTLKTIPEDDSEGPVHVCRLRFRSLPLTHRQLLTQGEVVNREISPGHGQAADGSEHDPDGESEK